MTNDFLNNISMNGYQTKVKKYKVFTVLDYLKITSDYSGFNDDKLINDDLFEKAERFFSPVMIAKIEDSAKEVVDFLSHEDVFNTFLGYYGVHNRLLELPEESTEEEFEEFEKWLDEELTSELTKGVVNKTLKENEILGSASGENFDDISYSYEQIPNLYNEIAKIELFNYKDIVNFANRYGLPLRRGYILNVDYDDIVLYNVNFMFMVNVALAKLKKDRKDFLDLLFHGRVYDTKTEKGKNSLPIKSHTFGNRNLTLKHDVETNNFNFQIDITDLFDLAYFQMSKALVTKAELKECLYCGHYFEKTHHRQEFCPPHPGLSRSSCKTAYHREVKTKERNEKAHGNG